LSNALDLIKLDQIPDHVAIIMDGNGRWAEKQGQMRIMGHHEGVNSVHEVTEAATRLNIKYLTLYTFSTENWNRPKEEIDALMELLVMSIKNETPTLMKNGIRLQTIGDLNQLPSKCKQQLLETVDQTKNNTNVTLILAISYSGRWDILQATKKIAEKVKAGEIDPGSINEDTLNKALNTGQFPNPDLLIRTSGEYRISNFLLWEIAYSEIHFTETLWPDFKKDDFYKAILDYQGRKRRFGKTEEQI
jgi:undecaprenyl diphosphate synthase